MTDRLVLIADDDEKSRKLVRDVLHSAGFETVEADNGVDALELAGVRAPVLAVLDIRLPGMDGMQVAKRLRESERTRAIKLVAVTASAMPEDRARILEAGFHGYLSKPIRVKEFLDTVKTLV